MWGERRSVHGFRFGDLQSALQKAARRKVETLFMLVGFEFLYSDPCSLDAAWRRLCTIVAEDYGSQDLLETVRGFYKEAIQANSFKKRRLCMQLWQNAMSAMFSYPQHRSNVWLAHLYAVWCGPDHPNPDMSSTVWSILRKMWNLHLTGGHVVREPTDLLFLAQKAVSATVTYSCSNDVVPKPDTMSSHEWHGWWETHATSYKLPEYVFDDHTPKDQSQGKGFEDFLTNEIRIASPVQDAPQWMDDCEREALRMYHLFKESTSDLFQYVEQQLPSLSVATGPRKRNRIPDFSAETVSVKASRSSRPEEFIAPSYATLRSLFPQIRKSVETDVSLCIAQIPRCRKPPTYFAFPNGDIYTGRFLKYAPDRPTVPKFAEWLKHTLGLPSLLFEWHGNWMVSKSLLRQEDLDASHVEGLAYPVVRKGKGINRRFQLNYALEDCRTKEERVSLFRRALPLQVVAAVCGFTDAQHNNFVVATDGHVYMVDHMKQRPNNAERIRTLMKQSVDPIQILYGNRPPPKRFQTDLWNAYREWDRSNADKNNAFWDTLQKNINVNMDVHQVRRYIWSKINE